MARPRLSEPVYRLTQRKRGGSWYVSWTEEGKTLTASSGLKVRAQAEVWKNQFAAARRADPVPEQPTIGEILDAYLADRKGNVEAHDRLGFAAKQLRPRLGDLQPVHLSRREVRDYIAVRRGSGVSDGTILREVITLRAALQFAVKARWIKEAPHVEAPPRPPARTRWLTREEAERLVHAAHSDHIRLFIVLALHTAGRRGALLGLTWDRVDLEGRRIYLALPGRTHSTKRRATVPINDRLLAELVAARRAALGDHVIEYGGGKVGSVKTGFRLACGRAGLTGVTPHVLRHTAASWMLQGGASTAEVARYLGDTEAMVERVYGHHSPDFLKNAARILAGQNLSETEKSTSQD